MRASLFVAGTLALAVITVVACTGTTEEPEAPGAGEAGTSGGSDSGNNTTKDGSSGTPVDSGGPSGNCTALTQEGAAVDIIATKATKPAATGGQPVDGKFVLTAVRAFNPPFFAEGTVIRSFGAYTIVLSGGGTKFEQIVTNDKQLTTRAKGDLVVTQPNKFKATPNCEEPPPEGGGFTIIEGEFTIEPTELKMYVVREFNVTAELTFTKK